MKEEQIYPRTAENTLAQNSISFATPEVRCQFLNIPLSHHQNLSKSLGHDLLSQKMRSDAHTSQQMEGRVPNLLNSEPQFNLSVNSNLSAQPTFVDLDVLRADQQKKTKTKER